MSREERRELIEKLLANRQVLRDRDRRKQLAQQDASVEFERSFKPLLDPARETEKSIARVAQTGEQTVRALETLPRDVAAVLPATALPPPAYDEAGSDALQTAPQKFNHAGRARIVSLGAVAAAAEMPPNWRDLLSTPAGIRPVDAAKEWIRWVWRESTGARQARGPVWDAFKEEVLAAGGPRSAGGQKKKGRGLQAARAPEDSDDTNAATRRRSGIRYYKNASELMDRLAVLHASVSAGNSSLEVANEASEILDHLHADRDIDDQTFEGLLRWFT